MNNVYLGALKDTQTCRDVFPGSCCVPASQKHSSCLMLTVTFRCRSEFDSVFFITAV